MVQRCLLTPGLGKEGSSRNSGWLSKLSEGMVFRVISLQIDVADAGFCFILNVVVYQKLLMIRIRDVLPR